MVRIQRTALKSFKSFLGAHTESKDARKQSQQCKPLLTGMTEIQFLHLYSGQYKLMQQQQAPKPRLYLSHVSTQTSPKPEFYNVQLQSELEIESEPRFFPRWNIKQYANLHPTTDSKCQPQASLLGQYSSQLLHSSQSSCSQSKLLRSDACSSLTLTT